MHQCRHHFFVRAGRFDAARPLGNRRPADPLPSLQGNPQVQSERSAFAEAVISDERIRGGFLASWA
jgi:hypothetical protein